MLASKAKAGLLGFVFFTLIILFSLMCNFQRSPWLNPEIKASISLPMFSIDDNRMTEHDNSSIVGDNRLANNPSQSARLGQKRLDLKRPAKSSPNEVSGGHNPTSKELNREMLTTEVKMYQLEETGSKLRGHSTSVSKSNNASCYPRLFAMVPAHTSGCDDSHAAAGRRSSPVQHLFFLKTHKTGSQTLTGIFNRYALVHNLSVAIRQKLFQHVAQGTQNWVPAILPLPPGVPHYDMITDHVRFNESCVWHFLPKQGTVLVSVVREPLDRFVSAFYYSRDLWSNRELKRIPGPDAVMTYLSNKARWDTPWGSMTHSRMAYDFGLEFKHLRNPQYLQTSIHYLSRVFHLVLLTEAFDESLVLLKRLLSWNLQDMLYVRFNVGKTRRPHNFTQEQREDFEAHRKEEYAIYRHFRSVFHEKVRAQGDSFAAEVKVFKTLRKNVESFCLGITASRKKLELRVESTKFSERFRVSLADCQLLMRESSSVRDVWFEQLMIRRLGDWREKRWQSSLRDTEALLQKMAGGDSALTKKKNGI